MTELCHPNAPFLPYACPDTHEPVVASGAALTSPVTGRRFPVSEGIPNFCRYPPSEDDHTSAQLERLVHVCKEQGWLAALQKLDPASARYVTDKGRARYLDLLPLTRKSRVLEVGASKGQHTCLIAPRSGSVHALEVVALQALFTSLRCTQLGYDNVRVAVGGDDCRLPYLDGSFNVVIANLVLEWCAGRRLEGHIREGQTRMLSECNRVLAPSGCLFLATKNRYSLRYLAGRHDEHSGLPFGNALPRWLMYSLRHLKNQRQPGGLLHSYGTLKKMLFASGFDQVTPMWAIPEARYPVMYIGLDRDSISKARRDGQSSEIESKVTRCLLRFAPARLIPWVMPSLVFLARKQSANTYAPQS